MNLIEYLYPLVYNDLINNFRFYQLFNVFFFFTVSNKYFDNDFLNVNSKY